MDPNSPIGGYEMTVDETTPFDLNCTGVTGEFLTRSLQVGVAGTTPNFPPPVPTCESTPRPEACDASPESFAPAAMITELALGSQSCCFDLNGHGSPDNSYGELIFLLHPEGFNDELADFLDTYSFTRLLEISGLSAVEVTSGLSVNAYLSTDPDPTDGTWIGEGSFDEGAHPNFYFPEASIVDDGGDLMVVAEGGTILLPILTDLASETVDPVALRDVQLEARIITTSAIEEDGVILSDGRLGGVLTPEALLEPLTARGAECDCLGNPEVIAHHDPFTGSLNCDDQVINNTCFAGPCSDLADYCEVLPALYLWTSIDA